MTDYCPRCQSYGNVHDPDKHPTVAEAALVHEGSCALVEAGDACEKCSDFEDRLADLSDHPELCSYTLKATAPERVEHYKTRAPECGGFWPDVTSSLASEYGLSEARVRELRGARQDQDGWPIGMALSQPEYYMVQSRSPEDLQAKREELATDDAIDFLVVALRSRHDVDRGEDYVAFAHGGHRFTAQVELDKDES